MGRNASFYWFFVLYLYDKSCNPLLINKQFYCSVAFIRIELIAILGKLLFLLLFIYQVPHGIIST
jgi:hypothetical protein